MQLFFQYLAGAKPRIDHVSSTDSRKDLNPTNHEDTAVLDINDAASESTEWAPGERIYYSTPYLFQLRMEPASP